MLTEDQFYEWFTQLDNAALVEWALSVYVKAQKHDALVAQGVDNWSGYEEAMRALILTSEEDE